MRLFDAVRRFFKPVASERPRYDWKRIDRMATIYSIDGIAAVLSEKQPYFRMRAGGIYALAIHRNKKGELKPSNFIRMDKDRRPRRERKRMRRMAKQLAEATL